MTDLSRPAQSHYRRRNMNSTTNLSDSDRAVLRDELGSPNQMGAPLRGRPNGYGGGPGGKQGPINGKDGIRFYYIIRL